MITVVVESDEAGKQVEGNSSNTQSNQWRPLLQKKQKTEETKETVEPVQEVKKVLEQVTSEAEVTNVLATEAIRKTFEAENKAAIEAR